MDSITLPVAPDDFHLHLRDGESLASLAKIPTVFKRAIIMPNLRPPIRTTDDALQYRDRILRAGFGGPGFEPLMTLYLTDNTAPSEAVRAKASGVVYAVKYYPAGATTNSDAGVTDMEKVMPTLAEMARVGMPLLVHGESTDPAVDVFDREEVFIRNQLAPLLARIPDLKVVMEHITTEQAVEFVMRAPDNVAATITAHHLLYNRNAIFQGGLRPHMYCLPVLKREKHRQALLRAVASGSPKFFLGTDSAPHALSAKASACGCAGVFTAHAALELYAEAFEEAGALHHLPAFACLNGARFYGLSTQDLQSDRAVRLVRSPRTVPASFPFGADVLVPLRAGEEVRWSVEVVAGGAGEPPE